MKKMRPVAIPEVEKHLQGVFNRRKERDAKNSAHAHAQNTIMRHGGELPRKFCRLNASERQRERGEEEEKENVLKCF